MSRPDATPLEAIQQSEERKREAQDEGSGKEMAGAILDVESGDGVESDARDAAAGSIPTSCHVL